MATRRALVSRLAAWTLALLVSASVPVNSRAQGSELEQRLAEIKQSSANNKQLLAQYTWIEHDAVILRGEQKKQEEFTVRLGADGKPVKSPMGLDPAPQDNQGGKLKRHIVEKKKEEYQDYAESMKTLAQQYVPPDKDLLQQAFQRGNIAVSPAGSSGEVKLVIKNYLKPNDSMTLTFSRQSKQIVSLDIATYLQDEKDAMNLTVQFAEIPSGPNHVSTLSIEGVQKHLTVTIRNSDYRKL